MFPAAALLFVAPVFMASGTDFKSEYLFEFDIASHQVTALAEAMPADKLPDWRPGPGVRSVGEVYVHIAGRPTFFCSGIWAYESTSRAPGLPAVTPPAP